MLKGRKDLIDLKNTEYLSDSVKKYFVSNVISGSEIQNYIKTMNPNGSVLSDISSVHFVKLSAKIISPYFSKLYNKCVEYGRFQELLIFAEVNPIYKSGKKMKLITYDLLFFYPNFQKILSF